MSINFRLSTNEGFFYTDLFPKTSVNFIQPEKNMIEITSLEVVIPATIEQTQVISIPSSAIKESSPVYMELITDSDQARKDYSTISQFEVTQDSLIITRIGKKPKGSIKVKLTFKEGHING